MNLDIHPWQSQGSLTTPAAAENTPVSLVYPRVSLPCELWPGDLGPAAQSRPSWLWQGYLAPGKISLLTSQWKSGKTTLLAVLLSRLKNGGQLAGLAVAPGKAVVVTEEDASYWHERSRTLDFGDHVCWLCRPFRGKPRPEEWEALLDRLAELQVRHGLNLVAIDPLAAFLPGRDEGNAGSMLQNLMGLRRLTALGASVFLQHHPRKGESLEGQAARGSGVLCAHVDIVLEMHWYTRASPEDRRRRLLAYSRHQETPRQLVIELTADGTDYLVHGNFQEDEFTGNWKVLQTVLEDARGKLTRQQIVKEWPADYPVPADVTLWRWLEQGVGQGLVCQDGTGRKRDPFRYWLPAKETQWQNDPVAMLLEQCRQDRQKLTELRGD